MPARILNRAIALFVLKDTLFAETAKKSTLKTGYVQSAKQAQPSLETKSAKNLNQQLRDQIKQATYTCIGCDQPLKYELMQSHKTCPAESTDMAGPSKTTTCAPSFESEEEIEEPAPKRSKTGKRKGKWTQRKPTAKKKQQANPAPSTASDSHETQQILRSVTPETSKTPETQPEIDLEYFNMVSTKIMQLVHKEESLEEYANKISVDAIELFHSLTSPQAIKQARSGKFHIDALWSISLGKVHEVLKQRLKKLQQKAADKPSTSISMADQGAARSDTTTATQKPSELPTTEAESEHYLSEAELTLFDTVTKSLMNVSGIGSPESYAQSIGDGLVKSLHRVTTDEAIKYVNSLKGRSRISGQTAMDFWTVHNILEKRINEQEQQKGKTSAAAPGQKRSRDWF